METEKQQQSRIVIQALTLQTCFDVKYHLKNTSAVFLHAVPNAAQNLSVLSKETHLPQLKSQDMIVCDTIRTISFSSLSYVCKTLYS